MNYIKRLAIFITACALLSTSYASPKNKYLTATFAGGCFWCLESDFEEVPGIISSTSGYSGGKLKNPTYKQVSSGKTNHMESIQVTYDPKKISYQKLLDIFWHNIDPTDEGGQFCDRGAQYRSAIFYHNKTQKKLAMASKKKLEKRFGQVETQIIPFKHFYPAEAEHQNYAKRNPVRYNFYRFQCRRDQRLKQVWGDS